MKLSTRRYDKPTKFWQSPNVVPLDYGLVQKENITSVSENVIQDIHINGDRLTTGFLGTASMMAWLPEVNPKLAFKLATQPNYPGWGYMIKQGATSMWETWDGDNSLNHPPFCLISAYFYKYLAGIQPDQKIPGFKHFTINPSIVGNLTFVNAYHESPYGRIGSNWKLENGRLTMKVSVPVNTTTNVFIPTIDQEKVLEGKIAVKAHPDFKIIGFENGYLNTKVGSGNYYFTSEIQ